MIKVLIVDDHQLVRYGLRSVLSNTEEIEVVGDVATGEEAIEFTRQHHPDVILMDIRMPGIGGLEATRRIAHSNPNSRVLVVTMCDVEPFPTILMQVGASGFLSKTANEAEMVTAIRSVAKGEQYISPEIAEAMSARALSGSGSSPFNALSDRELQVALMIITGKKNNHIAEKMYVSNKTICTYRYRIYEKLHIDSDVELALLAVQYGLIDNIPSTEE